MGGQRLHAGSLVASVALLGVFTVIEARSENRCCRRACSATATATATATART
jgi:hypothetical protein